MQYSSPDFYIQPRHASRLLVAPLSGPNRKVAGRPAMIGGGLPDEPLCPCTVPVIVVPSTVALPNETPFDGLKVTLGRGPPAEARPVCPAPPAPRPPAGGRMRSAPPPPPTSRPPPRPPSLLSPPPPRPPPS